MTPVLIEYGQGTSLRRADYTQAAIRAVEDALWRNSLDVAGLFGRPREAMAITARIGVARPEEVDRARVAAVFPYGRVEVLVEEGGLDVAHPKGGVTVLALAALHVGVAP